MLLSKVLGRISGRPCLFQVTRFELKVDPSRVIAAPSRNLTTSNNLELPSQYESASVRLSEALGCTKQEGCAILIEFPEIKKLNSTHLSSRCQYLTQDLGISPQLVVDFPWLLQFNKALLQERVTVLANKTKCAISSAVPLLQFTPEKLRKLFSYSYKEDETVLDKGHTDRIAYFSSKLKCSELETTDLISKHNFMLMAPLGRLDSLFKVLEEYKINPEDVKKDPWILRYKPEQIKARLDIIQSVGMDKAKPWLTRSTERVFLRSLAKYKKNEELLGKSLSKLDFMQNQLQLESKEEAVELARKYPSLLRMSAFKLKNGVESLLNAGFKLEDIKASPSVLAYSMSMVLERNQMLLDKYQYKSNLILLTRSTKSFGDFLARLEMKKKAESDLKDEGN